MECEVLKEVLGVEQIYEMIIKNMHRKYAENKQKN